MIDAAFNGALGWADQAFFASEEHVVAYRWTSPDRALSVAPLTSLIRDASGSAPAGFSAANLQAALDGEGLEYGMKGYIFKGADYVRLDWATRNVDTGYPAPISPAWKVLPGFSSGIEAAFSGRYSRSGKAYFFKGAQYLRYNWGLGGTIEASDPGYPKLISTLRGMPGNFASDLGAALSGMGSWSDFGYLFKGAQYVRFDWRDGALRIDSGPASKPIADNWTGLVELIFAGLGLRQASSWIVPARRQLADYRAHLQTGAAFPHNLTLMTTALATHFHIDASWSSAQKLTHLTTIEDNYREVANEFPRCERNVRFRTNAEAAADGGVDSAGVPHPGYAFHRDLPTASVNFTTSFRNFGPLCRAAMVLHEHVHFVDSQATGANDTYEHSPAYATINVNQAVHNPSSYVCFAQHIFYGTDERYGAGRPTL